MYILTVILSTEGAWNSYTGNIWQDEPLSFLSKHDFLILLHDQDRWQGETREQEGRGCIKETGNYAEAFWKHE